MVWGSAGADKGNLAADLLNHVLSGVTDSRHGKSGEEVGNHGTEEQTSEGEGLKDVHVERARHVFGNTGNVSAEESQSDEAGRADGEALADSGGCVTSSVELVSLLADRLVKVAHLGDTTSVVRDGSVAVNGEADWEAAKHTEGCESDTVHSSPVEAHKHGDGKADDGDHARHVSKSKTLDHVGGSVEEAGTGELAGRAVGVRGVVLSGQTNQEAGPETEHDAAEGLDSSRGVGGSSERNVEAGREDPEGGHDADGHQHGAEDELGAELGLGVGAGGSKLHSDEAGDDADCGHEQREVNSVGGRAEGPRGRRNDESSASRLSEGAEQVSAHTSDVTNVVTDVVGDGAGVEGRVLIEGLTDLASKISTDIGGLGVDTATDTTEQSDSGAAKTVS